MYRSGYRFGVPCLLPLALKKLEGRIWENFFSNEELIEAASYAWEDYRDEWEDHEELDLRAEYEESMSSVRTKILAQAKARWETVRVKDDFEKLVLRRPEFGRDVLRIV